MSLSSWKEEFYQIEAMDCPEEEAVSHSLKKWEGLRKEVLEEHGLWVESSNIKERVGPGVFSVSSYSCALCVHNESCESCALFKARCGVECDHPMEDELISPWHSWTNKKDPEPMIYWLSKAV